MVDEAEVHRMVHSEDSSERIEALRQLVVHFPILDDTEQATKNLFELTKDKDSYVRWSAANALGSVFAHITDKGQGTKTLFELTKDEDSFVRGGAANALGSVFAHITDKEQGTKTLLELTKDEDNFVRRGAVDALVSAFVHVTDKEQAWIILLELTKDKDSNVRSRTANALGSVFAHVTDKEQKWKTLLTLAKDKNRAVEGEAARALGSAFAHLTDKRQATKDLFALTKDENNLVRREAVHALKSSFVQDTEEYKYDAFDYLDMLTDGNSSVSSNATDTLNRDLLTAKNNEQNQRLVNDNLSSMNELSDSPTENESKASFIKNDASVHKANLPDKPATKDFLGFEPYVEAIYEFLKNPATKAPLTLSIEGTWGIGKSSFMAQLRNKFDNDEALTVEFNPWRHDKAYALWAFFAMEFLNQLKANLTLWQKVKSWFVLFKFRYKLEYITRKRLIYFIIFIIPILLYLYPFVSKRILLTILSSILILIAGIVRFRQEIINPLANDFKKYFSSPNYGQHIAFIERFHKDFKNIVDAYTINRGKDEKMAL